MKRFIFFLGVILAGLLGPQAVLAASASLSLSPASKVVEVGDQLDINVLLDTAGASVSGVDVVLNYPADKLEYVSATAGTILPQMSIRSNTAGKLSLNLVTASGTYEGKGTLATITFKAKAQGDAPVTFVFVQGSTTSDSNVVSNNEDILALVSGGNYTIQAAGTTGSTSDSTGTGDTAGSGTTTSDGITPTMPVTGPGNGIIGMFFVGILFSLVGAAFWLAD
ncbi:MAG: hypothetical protein GXP43_00435 [bacterium]|nr:hypothetical protein [bacterium]